MATPPGDAALREFSRRLKRAIRACDIPVRLGGDEFLVILPECPRDKVNVIIERTGTPQIEFNGEKIHVCYSVGIAQYQPSDTSEAMLARADQVLYVKKQARPRFKTVASIAKNALSLDPDSGMTPLPIDSLDLMGVISPRACDSRRRGKLKWIWNARKRRRTRIHRARTFTSHRAPISLKTKILGLYWNEATASGISLYTLKRFSRLTNFKLCRVNVVGR